MIDREELSRQTFGDIDLQLELLTLFHAQLTELRDRVRVVTAAPRPAAAADLPALLHRVRGAASAVGAMNLALRLSRAEEALVADPLCPAVLDDLCEHAGQACTVVASLIAASGSPGLAKAGESR